MLFASRKEVSKSLLCFPRKWVVKQKKNASVNACSVHESTHLYSFIPSFSPSQGLVSPPCDRNALVLYARACCERSKFNSSEAPRTLGKCPLEHFRCVPAAHQVEAAFRPTLTFEEEPERTCEPVDRHYLNYSRKRNVATRRQAYMRSPQRCCKYRVDHKRASKSLHMPLIMTVTSGLSKSMST